MQKVQEEDEHKWTKKEIQPEEMSVCHSVWQGLFFLFYCCLSLSQVFLKKKIQYIVC